MNFVIHDEDCSFNERYKTVIFKIMSNSKVNYKTHYVKNINDLKDIEGNNIYLVDIDDKGFDIAKEIRKSGDWTSPIIAITANFKIELCCKERIMISDIIYKDDSFDCKLYEALHVAVEINSYRKYLCLSCKREIYQLPYDDILFIMKSVNDNSSVIVTREHEYIIRKSIVSLEKELCDDVFYKTHRSCIVNINNIKCVDLENNIIEFANKKIDLLSRANKKGLKIRLGI